MDDKRKLRLVVIEPLPLSKEEELEELGKSIILKIDKLLTRKKAKRQRRK
jgi:hypothetical protein